MPQQQAKSPSRAPVAPTRRSAVPADVPLAATHQVPQLAPEQQRQELLLHRYRVVEKRGSGGFATVDVCWDTRLRRRVAIKRIPLAQADGPTPWQAVNEALAESRTSALLAHPNIVTVFDFEYDNAFAYIVMEYVDGLTLAELLARVEDGRLTGDEAAHVLDCLANALAFAHENGVLHLDIKPANVLIDRGGIVKLGDFGMATLASAAGFGGARGGTVGYMSPEQLTGEFVDERSDVFSLGCLTYEMLSGRAPFNAPTMEKSLKLIEHGTEPLEAIVPEVGPEISQVVEAALSQGPITRPQSVGAFADALLPILGDTRIGQNSIRSLMGQVEGEDEQEAIQWKEAQRREPREVAPWVVPFCERLIAAAACAALAWQLAPGLPLWRLPAQVQPFGPQLIAGVVGAIAALLPQLGTATLLVELVAVLGFSGAQREAFPLAVGLALTALVWFVATHRNRCAGAALVLPSITGIPTSGAALAGWGCTPGAAALTGFAGCLLAALVRPLMTGGFVASVARDQAGVAYAKPSTWVCALACGLGACVAAACSSPEHPLRTALGQLACAACAVAGLLYAARLENGGIWVEPRMDAVAVAVSFSLLMAIVGALIGAGNTSKEQL